MRRDMRTFKDKTLAWISKFVIQRRCAVDKWDLEPFIFDWDDIEDEEMSKAANLTLMGPPKEYVGDVSNRYAYMLLDAISLLKKVGYSATIFSSGQTERQPLRQMNLQARRKNKVPGILGQLMRDVSPSTRIQIHDERGSTVAYLAFMSYSRPWLNVHCISTEDKMAARIKAVLYRHFLLVELPHGSESIPVDTTGLKLVNKTGFGVRMTRGMAKGKAGPFVKFVLEREGSVVCRALWLFQNQPSIVSFESASEWRDFGLDYLLLSIMEQTMIGTLSPLVCFQLRICSVSDPGINRFLTQRGYADTDRTGACLCKGFVVF